MGAAKDIAFCCVCARRRRRLLGRRERRGPLAAQVRTFPSQPDAPPGSSTDRAGRARRFSPTRSRQHGVLARLRWADGPEAVFQGCRPALPGSLVLGYFGPCPASSGSLARAHGGPQVPRLGSLRLGFLARVPRSRSAALPGPFGLGFPGVARVPRPGPLAWFRPDPLLRLLGAAWQRREAQINADQCQATQGNAKQCKAMPSSAKHRKATPGNAEQRQATPSNAKQR